ncbi:AhpC/TSA family protein [Mucilaginibacter sp. FT3.2]|uniref:DUF6436 domain-containing protein n=1 Tax=Mucilaginibacter sp. FT3.2 TaxID=2723090 RepID=UPI00161834AB|nr:AhpC/TSA family protein [Mucilaginibacter sp. FT3.2]MBB6230979.1 hypothetical protein [Mucilaginibacter sp. FT3.2]
MRKVLAIVWLSIITVSIGGIFWYNDYVYNLPTPVPAGYHSVANGKHISVGAALRSANGKPLFLHFFNPDCPCSRFNIAHFKTLVKQYGNRANFAVVLTTDKYYTAAQVKQKFNIDVPVVIDPALALACGVYSTPQAAILNSNGNLYYRGNYNSSRYCTNQKTAYASMALAALLNNTQPVKFNQLALTAYGCRLPGCKP